MEKDIVEGKLGSVGAYDVEFKGGKLTAKVGVEHVGLSASLVLEMGAAAVFEALKKAIPGTIDDAILDGALKLLEGEKSA